MDELRYEVGSVVRLKSGGPDMAVNGYSQVGLTFVYTCSWFTTQNELQSGRFFQDALKEVTDGHNS